MSRAASSSSGETKSFWRRPRLSSQCNASSANRFAGPTIRVAAPSSQMQPLTNRRLTSSPQQQSSDEEDEELRSFLTIREPIPRHSAGARRGRDESPSSPASSFDSTRLSPWSTPTSPRWSGSTTPPGSSSLEGHSPGLSTSLSSSPFSDASVVVSSDPRKNSRDGVPFAKCVSSSASTSSSPGCRVSLNGDQPPPPCNIWAGGFKWQDPPEAARAKNRDECLQISDFWKYHHRRSSDVSSDAESRRGDDIDASFDGTRRVSSFDALELDSDDSFVDAVRGARPKISLPVPKHSLPKNNFPEPQQPSYPGRSKQDSKEPCCHCKPSPNLMPLECCEQDARGQGDEPLGSGVGSRKGLNWPCTLQPPTQRCEDCLYSVPLSSGIQWVQASCGKFPWNRRRGSGVLVHEVDEGQPCLTCKDKCPGFSPHLWRKVCNNCKCPRESHDVYHEEFVNVRDRIGIKAADPSQHTSKEKTLQEGYSWVPPGLSSVKIEEYFGQLPNHKVPRLGSPGEKYRDRQLIVQLPKQDLALAYCKFLERECQRAFEDFVNARNEIALDIGYVREALDKTLECNRCGGVLPGGELAVIAPKFGELVAWHPACFVCSSCHELLVDLTYCAKDGKLYCERHYAETLKPRCAACDELIFSGEYTKAMNKDWHSSHFCCWQCDDSLTGQRYVLRDEHPYCVRCYEQVFANSCEECSKAIGIDSKDLSYKEKHWHEACFLCSKCRVSLVDKPFGSKAEKVYCAACYDAAFATRCDGCGEIFRAGTKKMEYKGHQWHEKCFCCCVCSNPIGTRSFIPRDNDIYCTGCYEDKFATRCIKCNQIITSGGVTYRNEPWHRECFTCTNCSASLAGQRFTSRDEKPFCAECFGELFAKRCTACSKPITGIGGTRFISFEDRNWHNDCFICAMCNNSLVGKGFITDGPDILCPECARQKLM